MWTAAVPTRASSPPTTRGCVVADYDKASIQTYRYGPHGEPDSGGSPDRLGYAGGVDVAELGIMIMGARVYSPAMGRFLQTDPIGIAGGANVYDYAGGGPVNGVDPSGFTPEADAFWHQFWIDYQATADQVVVTGNRPSPSSAALASGTSNASGAVSGGGGVPGGGGSATAATPTVVVTARRNKKRWQRWLCKQSLRA